MGTPTNLDLVVQNATTNDDTPDSIISSAEIRIRKLQYKYGELEPFKGYFENRIKRFDEWKRLFDLEEGGLTEFAKGYLKFGFNRGKGSVVYREWAQPAEEAQLVVSIGSDVKSTREMEKDKFGVWTVEIPNYNDNEDSIITDQDSRVKFRFKLKNGDWIDRVPAWIKSTSSAAPYDGVYWETPPSVRYKRGPSKPKQQHIYIAHFGKPNPGITKQYTFKEFAQAALLHILEKHKSCNTILLVGVMEHSSYGPLGYDVTNFFAVSSSSGIPEDLKDLIDKAHILGLRVIMDVVHSHVSCNTKHGLSGFDVGQPTQDSYFHTGERGYHKLWRSRLFNYSNWEVLRFLLSNLSWWLEEFLFDGFCFFGVTSMSPDHHGIEIAFTGRSNDDYIDAGVYMMLANELIRLILPDATVIAKDVSGMFKNAPGMPDLRMPLEEGGIGYDFSNEVYINDEE